MAFSPRESFWLVGMERVVGTHPEYETGMSMIQGLGRRETLRLSR